MKTLEGREQENLYDGEGLRAGLREDGKYTTFLYHDGEILTEGDGDSMPVRRHIRGVGLSHVQDLKDGGYHTYHQDEQGSTAYITGADDRAENCYWYDAFGSLLEKREGMRNRILYTGQQYDQATGQYYLRARYYNPVVGRFLQEDTYRGDGLNLYAYCADNPVGYYDPSGHTGEDCPPRSSAKPGDTQGGQVDNASKKCPNPDGRKGGKAHQDIVHSIEAKSRGEMAYEYGFYVSGGYKNRRYADAVEIADDEIVAIHQVGKLNKNGTPVARERRAIEDIMKSDINNGVSVYFWPYNSNARPIVYQKPMKEV